MHSRIYISAVAFAAVAVALLTPTPAGAALVVAPSAQADEFEVPWSVEAEIAYLVALDYWNVSHPPNCGSVQKILGVGPPAHTDMEIGRAVATHADTFWDRCVLITTDGLPFSEMCPAVVHAVGHLLGQPHSSDPAHIMYGGRVANVTLCRDEAARLAGFGAVAAQRIKAARKRCVTLRRKDAAKRRVRSCRRVEARVRRRLAKFLRDPYRPRVVLPAAPTYATGG